MACNKISFESKKEIKRWLKDKARFGTYKTVMTPYECVYCGQWHSTSMSKRAIKLETKKYKLKMLNKRV